MAEEYSDDHPEVIRAKAEAEARLLEARAKLHPAAQVTLTIIEGVGSAIATIGCFAVLALIVLAACAPTVLQRITGGG